MRLKLLLISLLALLAFWVGQPIAAQDLMSSPWYAVVQTLQGDELVWVNRDGVQAALVRPRLPDEKEDSESEHDLRISPDGRYAVISAMLNNGQQGLGIYDFEKGAFVKTHTAQPGETIVLGSQYSFMPDSTNIAVGFYTLTSDNVTDWRIIQFTLATGNSKGVLQKSDQRVTEPPVAAGAYPYVIFSPGITQLFSYYFKMMPYGENSSAYETLAWAPNGNVILSLGPLDPGFDVLSGTTHFIESDYDSEQSAVEFDGPASNVITHRTALNKAAETLFHDDSAFLSLPRWSHNGEWFAYQSVTPDEETSWVVRTVEGDESHVYNNPTPSEFYGTSDGYLLNYGGKTLVASTEVDGSSAPVIYETPRGDTARLIYITPQDGIYALTSIKGSSPTPTQISLCEGAPESQVDVDMSVHVVKGTLLQVRFEPGLNTPHITDLAENTEFTLVEGPVCLDGSVWWRMALTIPGGILRGWVSEGTAETYFIEPS